MSNFSYLVFGPAYLDIVVDIDCPLITEEPRFRLDQSLPATQAIPRDDGMLQLANSTGDSLQFPLPAGRDAFAATYYLAEPVLARRLGEDTQRTVTGEYLVTDAHAQIGGMGAGYALACHGTLRMPVGHDAIGQAVLQELSAHRVKTVPYFLDDCPSDTSLVVLSPHGDKLAVGVRQAMVRWQATEEDRALVRAADAIIFCGAPNALVAEVLSWGPDIPIMCAPAMRNVCDTAVPLADLTRQIHYLTLNTLEWEHLDGKEAFLQHTPLVSVTDGPRGSNLYTQGGRDFYIPCLPKNGAINTNRAGETYGSTLFKVLLHEAPGFFQGACITPEQALRAGRIATKQATRQLDIVGFAFPPDDWVE